MNSPPFEEEKQKKKLGQLLHQEEEDTARLIAEKHRLPYIDLAVTPVAVDALRLVAESEARAAELAVIQKTGKRLDIALHNPKKQEAVNTLKQLENDNFIVSLFIVSKNSLEKAWKFYQQVVKTGSAITGQIQISDEKLLSLEASIQSLDDLKSLITEVSTKRTTDVSEALLAGALKLNASDVHCEPQANEVRIRYRLDGMLHDVGAIPAKVYHFLLSRIKLISELKLNINTRGQDGRFTVKVRGTEIEVRTSTLPGPYGENIVMRILNPATIGLELADLGMQPTTRKTIERELKKPNGMILTTGPTGSGKTTTLYAFLKKVHTPEIKIITLEDPIEYHLPGIEQTQVAPESGYDFASGLRSILRQDPDVILVGEIRDLETAETAMHASLTGHLVFSTLHTNNAAGTIPRLLDIGVKPAIIAPAINLAMAQRLLRRLCVQCKNAHPATKEEVEAFARELSEFPKKIKKPSLKNLRLFSATGCKVCNSTGYQGRIGVYEIIRIDDAIEKLIFKNPAETDMKIAAFNQGELTMRQDGILKILDGLSTLAELDRVVGEGSEQKETFLADETSLER